MNKKNELEWERTVFSGTLRTIYNIALQATDRRVPVNQNDLMYALIRIQQEIERVSEEVDEERRKTDERRRVHCRAKAEKQGA